MSVALTGTRLQSRSTDLLGTALSLSTLALAAVAISANFTDYGPLIPLLQQELHATSGATGLLSTLLYVGIGISYLPGGWLADRYGSRRVLFGSLLLALDAWPRPTRNTGTGTGDRSLAGRLFRPLLWAAAVYGGHARSRGPLGRNALSPPGWPTALAQGLHAQCANEGGNRPGLP